MRGQRSRPAEQQLTVGPSGSGATYGCGAHGTLVGALCACVCLAGCAARSSRPAVTATQQPWAFQHLEGLQITTDHFDIYTTVDDVQLRDYLPTFLEACYGQYSSLLPPPPDGGRRLRTYVFANKPQWLTFTRRMFPRKYDVYSRIRVGGYAEGAMCVAYNMRPRTYALSVIAHEGMHQYFAAHFRPGIPAWLNEGLATYCEGFDIVHNKPVFAPEQNSVRRNSLRRMLAGDTLMPLANLLGTNAGRVIVGSRGSSTETYYAQAWALVVFLRHGAKGRYADGFEAMLADVAAGKLSTRAQAARITAPQPASVPFGEAVFRAYITEDLPAFETQLREFMTRLVGFK